MAVNGVVIPVQLGIQGLNSQINRVQSQLKSIALPQINTSNLFTGINNAVSNFVSGFNKINNVINSTVKGVALITLTSIINDIPGALAGITKYTLAFIPALTGVSGATQTLSNEFANIPKNTNRVIQTIKILNKNYYNFQALVLGSSPLLIAALKAIFLPDNLNVLPLIFKNLFNNYNQLGTVIKKFTFNQNTLLGRYTNYLNIAEIVKELVKEANGFALQKGVVTSIELLSRPIKITEYLTQAATAARTFGNEIIGLNNSLQGLNLDILKSAASLVRGQGFAAINQYGVAVGGLPSIFNLFDTRDAIEHILEFESFTATLNSVYAAAGATTGQINNLNESILNTAQRTGMSIEQTANLSDAVRSAGFAIEDNAKIMKAVSPIAIAHGEDINSIAGILGNLQSLYDINTNELVGLSEVLNKISVEGGGSFTELSQAILEIAPIALSANQSLEDVLTLFNSVQDSGIHLSNAMTGIEAVFENLQAVAARDEGAVDLLSRLGLSPEDILNAEGEIKRFPDLLKVLTDSVTSYQNEVGVSASTNLLTLLFSQEGANLVNTLIKSSASNINALASEAKAFNQEILKNQNDTFSAQLQRIADSASVVLTKFGSFLRPLVRISIGYVEDIVGAFARLPTAAIIGLAAFNLVIPALVAYYKGMMGYVQITKLAAAVTAAKGAVIDIVTGKLTFQQIVTKLSVATQQTWNKLTAIGTGITKVFTREITLQAAAQKILAAATAVGNANWAEFTSTSRGVVALTKTLLINLTKFVLKAALIIGTLTAALYALGEMFRTSEGKKYSDDINKLTKEFIRANPEATKFGQVVNILEDSLDANAGGIANFLNTLGAGFTATLLTAGQGLDTFGGKLARTGEAFSDFVDNAKETGLAAALQEIVASMVQGSEAAQTFGKQNRFLTAEQRGAQSAMLALEKQGRLVNVVLDNGFEILGRYSDRTKLNADEIESFNEKAESQLQTLVKLRDSIRDQVPVNEELATAQQAQVNILDKQIALLRGRIRTINNETEEVVKLVASYDELIKKYKELEFNSNISFQTNIAEIEEAAASGEITSGEAQLNRLRAEAERLTQNATTQAEKLKDFSASLVGETEPDKVAQIQEEINKTLTDQITIRQDIAKNQQEINRLTADSAKTNVNETIALRERSQTISELSKQLELQSKISSGEISRSDAESISNNNDLESLRTTQQIINEEKAGYQDLAKQKFISESEFQQKKLELEEQSLKTQIDISNKLLKQQEAARQKIYEATLDDIAKRQEQFDRERAQSQLDQLIAAQQGASKESITNSRLQAEIAAANQVELLRSQEEAAFKQLLDQGAIDAEKYETELTRLRQEEVNNRIDIVQAEIDQTNALREQAITAEQQRIEKLNQLAELSDTQQQINLASAELSGVDPDTIARQQAEIELKALAIRENIRQQELSGLEQLHASGAIQYDEYQNRLVDLTQRGADNRLAVINAEIDRDRFLREQQIKQLEEINSLTTAGLESQISGLDREESSIQFDNDKLKLSQEIYGLISQDRREQLQHELAIAEQSDNIIKSESIRLELISSQRQENEEQRKIKLQELAVNQQLQKIESDRAKINAEIAINEAKLALEKLKINQGSAVEIQLAQQALASQQQQLEIIRTEVERNREINQLKTRQINLEADMANKAVERQLAAEKIAIENERVERAKQKIEELNQKITTESERQVKALNQKSSQLDLILNKIAEENKLTEETQSLTDAQNKLKLSQLENELKLAEVAEDASKIESLKSEIYLENRDRIKDELKIKEDNLQLSKEQQKLELEKERLSAKAAINETKLKLAKQSNLKVDEAEIALIKAQLDIQNEQLKFIDKQAQNIDDITSMQIERANIEAEIALNNLDTERSVARQQKQKDDLIEKEKEQQKLLKDQEDAKKVAIEEEKSIQKSLLDYQEKSVEVINAALERRNQILNQHNELLNISTGYYERESSLLSAQDGLADAEFNQVQQRLNFQLEIAKIKEDELKIDKIKAEIEKQKLNDLKRNQEIERQNLIIKEKQNQLEFIRRENQAKIAIAGSEADIARAKTEGASSAEINALQRALAIQREAFGQLQQEKTLQQEINQLERDRLQVTQETALEAVKQRQTLDKLRETGNLSGIGATNVDLSDQFNKLPSPLTSLQNDNQLINEKLQQTLDYILKKPSINNLTVVSNNPSEDVANIYNDLAAQTSN